MIDKKQGWQPTYVGAAINPPNCRSGVEPSNPQPNEPPLQSLPDIVTIDNYTPPKAHYGMSCIICGDTVDLTPNEELSLERGHHIHSKVCDKCREAVLHIRNKTEHIKEHENYLADMTDDDIALMEYDFKVGDTVITDTGMVGVIESICDCDRCKARGFYEPEVKVTDGDDDTIWITDTDKANGFISFYQIGKYKFGNIDKESVERWIENENNNIKESSKRLKSYKEQLRRLKRLEFFKEKTEQSSSEDKLSLDWLL